MISLPQYQAAELFAQACAIDVGLASDWRRAIAAGTETGTTRDHALGIACNALAHARFVAESEQDWFDAQLHLLRTQLKTGKQARLAVLIVQAARERPGRFVGLIAPKILARRFDAIELGFNCIQSRTKQTEDVWS